MNVIDLPSVDEQYRALRDGLIKAVGLADDLAEVKDHIRATPLELTDRERLIKAVQVRQDELINVRVPLGTLRRELAGPGRVVRVAEDRARPEWCDDWVWVTAYNSFFNMGSNKPVGVPSFNMLHNKDVPDIKPRPQATLFVSQGGYVPTVQAPVYLPMEDDKLVWVDGQKCVNTFNSGSVPSVADDYSDAGSLYLNKVEDHILMMCGTAENAAILTQWLAHQVQFPGRKILWAPLIQSVEGVGKSFFARLLRCGLGIENVGVVNPDQLTSTFNGWAGGVCVNVLEELKIAGHNRHEALNAVKPLITDDFIQINEKGVSAYVTPNVTNYVAFTNSMDALPLSAADRRWWVIQCLLGHYTEVPGYLEYFPALFEGLIEHAAEVGLWLSEYPITDEFLNMKQAPMTDAKALMVATEEASFEGLSEVREVIEAGGYLFDTEVLSSADVFMHVRAEYPDLFLHTNKRATILKRLGYQSMIRRLKIDGKMKQFWSKGAVTAEEIRVKWPESSIDRGKWPIVGGNSDRLEGEDG